MQSFHCLTWWQGHQGSSFLLFSQGHKQQHCCNLMSCLAVLLTVLTCCCRIYWGKLEGDGMQLTPVQSMTSGFSAACLGPCATGPFDVIKVCCMTSNHIPEPIWITTFVSNLRQCGGYTESGTKADSDQTTAVHMKAMLRACSSR